MAMKRGNGRRNLGAISLLMLTPRTYRAGRQPTADRAMTQLVQLVPAPPGREICGDAEEGEVVFLPFISVFSSHSDGFLLDVVIDMKCFYTVFWSEVVILSFAGTFWTAGEM